LFNSGNLNFNGHYFFTNVRFNTAETGLYSVYFQNKKSLTTK
jgi:hypothetical protein